jgi:hypothetical protein
MNESAHIRAHTHSIRHRDEIFASERCGCFYCLAIFEPGEIERWITEKADRDSGMKDDSGTAFCPKCGIDSVIGSASGFPITAEFLAKMNKHWF